MIANQQHQGTPTYLKESYIKTNTIYQLIVIMIAHMTHEQFKNEPRIK